MPAPPNPYQPYVQAVAKAFPKLGAVADQFEVRSGTAKHGGQLEFYPPWEQYNPVPGKATIEIYNKGLKGEYLASALAGEMLHHLGSVDPRSGAPVDPVFRRMKEAFSSTFTESQTQEDLAAFESQRKQFNPDVTFEDFRDWSRTDAYIRGYIFPDERDEWRKSGVYTKEQKFILDLMKDYIRGRWEPGAEK